jgi:hypothetical protein
MMSSFSNPESSRTGTCRNELAASATKGRKERLSAGGKMDECHVAGHGPLLHCFGRCAVTVDWLSSRCQAPTSANSSKRFRQSGYNLENPINPGPNTELSILDEKLRALETLMRYDRDLTRLKIYKRELDVVSVEMQRAVEVLDKRQSAKVIPFRPKKPARSA